MVEAARTHRRLGWMPLNSSVVEQAIMRNVVLVLVGLERIAVVACAALS